MANHPRHQVPALYARDHLTDLLNRAIASRHTEITRYGKPIAVLVPYEWYRDMLAGGEDATEEPQP